MTNDQILMTNYSNAMTGKLVVGLGTNGKEYAETRHSFGARVVQVFSEQNPEIETLLPQPGVFMNDFGQIVPKNREIILVHDDIELPLGEWKFQEGGSAKGHKGVKSVQAALGTQAIPRLRLGIGRPPEGADVSDYVLENFTAEEEKIVERVTKEAVAHLTRLVMDESPSPS